MSSCYGFDLTETLETYLHENCDMNATATAMSAHGHTVAHLRWTV